MNHINTIMETLIRLWKYDIEVLSQPWLYQWVLVPATGYMIFFMLKWTMLSAPLWLPISVLIRGWKQK